MPGPVRSTERTAESEERQALSCDPYGDQGRCTQGCGLRFVIQWILSLVPDLLLICHMTLGVCAVTSLSLSVHLCKMR